MITLRSVTSLTAIEKAANSSFELLEARQIPILDDRLRSLTHISMKQAEHLLQDSYSRALLGLAIADTSYIALGARDALASAGVSPTDIPSAIKASKPNLLTLSDLHEPTLRDLQFLWSSRYSSDMSRLPTQVQEVNVTPFATVCFTESALDEINNGMRSGDGCPARGAIMDRFFDRFVDVVLV